MSALDAPAALRERVAYLGRLLGDVLHTYASPGTYACVEGLRELTRLRREAHDAAAERALDAYLDGIPTALAIDVVRAFGLYFQLVNVAEQLHRERRRRERIVAGAPPQPGALDDLDGAELEAVLGAEITLVFTAHPTEVQRRTTSEKVAALAALLRDADERTTTPEESDARDTELRALITLLWQSNELYRTAPTVADEVRNLVARFRESLYDETTALYERLDARAGRTVPTLLRYGSWIGGDRDGNAAVAPDAIRAAHEQARRFVLSRYIDDVERVQARLSQDIERGDVAPELLAALEADALELPDVRYTIGPRQAAEPYRRKLAFIHRRLTLARDGAPGGYPGPAALLAELRLLEAALVPSSGPGVARPLVRLRRAVEVFGFHVCALEWRQHRARVSGALDEIVALIEPGTALLSARSRAERQAWFERELATLRPLVPRGIALGADAADVVASLDAVAALRAQRGAEAVHALILAGSEDAHDILALHVLARACGAFDAGPVQLVPLLETQAALDGAAEIAGAALATPPFRAHVAACGDVWEIMVGYSDSTKVIGIVAASLGIFEAQVALAEVFARNGVALRVFHGRGGSVGRGAAEPADATAAQPFAARGGRYKVTEQGEAISARYGLPSLARRNLERTVTAVARAARAGRTPEPAWLETCTQLADRSRAAYSALVVDPAFLRFFAASTPFAEIGQMQISSRPGRRGAQQTIEDLRAIPWSFGWTQSRALLPGWYGFGSAVAAASAAEIATVRAMFDQWPFFAVLVRGVERALAVADIDVFERYARTLVEEPALLARFLPVVRDEYQRSVDAVRRVSGVERLLAGDPTLARAIALRNPYVDAISVLQVRLLAAARRSGGDDPVLRDAIRLSINGIAGGLRVTG